MISKIELKLSEGALLKWLTILGLLWAIGAVYLLFVVPFSAFAMPIAVLIVGVNIIALLFVITVFSARFVNGNRD